MTVKKTAFTLLEVLVAFALLITSLGTLSFSIMSWIQKTQFEQEAMRLKEQLQQAYDLVQETKIDVRVGFTVSDQGLLCELSSENPQLIGSKIKRVLYPHLKAKLAPLRKSLLISYYGSLSETLQLKLLGPKNQNQVYTLYNYPHVL